MTRFEYLVVEVRHDRVQTANGHWQGEVGRGEPDADETCPSLFEYLEGAGAQGWELVAIDPEEAGTARLFFKRAHR